MIRKPKKATVLDCRGGLFSANKEFKVESLKNSTSLVAGEYISKEKVDELIRTGWDITIKEKKGL